MKKLIGELKILDDILDYISNQNSHSASIDDLKKSNLFDLDRLNFLEEEGLIIKAKVPIVYRLTQKGIVFILTGGFKNETIKRRTDRLSNLIYLLSSPSIAFVSLLLSLAALYFSLKPKSNPNDQPLNFSSEIKITLPEMKDTVIKQNAVILPK